MPTYTTDELTKAGHPSSNNELGKTIRSALQDSANDHDGRAQEDRLATSQPVTNPDRGDRARETTQVVGSDSDTCP